MMLQVVDAIVSNFVFLLPKLDIRSVSKFEIAALGWSRFKRKVASGMRLNGVWLTQLNWVVTNSFLPTCEQKGWCCHDTGLFSFSYQSFRYSAVSARL
jgi:hypothetical protein